MHDSIEFLLTFCSYKAPLAKTDSTGTIPTDSQDPGTGESEKITTPSPNETNSSVTAINTNINNTATGAFKINQNWHTREGYFFFNFQTQIRAANI